MMKLLGKLTAAMLVLVTVVTHAQSAAISGSVREKGTDKVIPGAQISISNSSMTSASDFSGNFELEQIPEGEHTITVTAIGFVDDSVKVEVKKGEVSAVTVYMEKGISGLPRMVISERLEGQTRAYNIQMNSDNIKNVISADNIERFPDQNSAEALQRMPGISVARDQGEGRYVQVRGSQPSFTTVSVNGVSIPAPEGDIRSVALDVIPADVLSQIEVAKAVTPEMDGGAIGGAVNLETRKATSEKLTLQTSASFGYNALNASRENGTAPVNGQGTINVGKRFGEGGKMGLLVGGSYLLTNRGSDNSEFEWDGDALEELQLRDYTVTRDRLGINTTFDYRLNERNSFFISGLYNRFGDQEYRRRAKLKFEDSEVERELKDRYEVQDIIAVNAGSEHSLGIFRFEPRVAYSFAQETEPDAFYSIFKMEDVDMAVSTRDRDFPKFLSSTGITEASAYELDGIEINDNITNENNFEGALDITMPVRIGQNPLEIKAGIKGRKRKKMRDNKYEEYSYEGENAITMDQVAGDYNNPDYLLNKYPGSAENFQDPQKVKDLFDSDPSFQLADEEDLIEDNWAADYDATENVGAGYIQGKYSMGKVSVLAGLRMEYTGAHYTGYKVDLDNVRRTEVSGHETSLEALPMAHLKYSPLNNMNVRASYTRSFARPDFYSFVPYRLEEDREVEIGNSDLENTHSHNVDLLAEYYFRTIGVVSGGFFLKSMDNFIYNRTWEQNHWIREDGRYTQAEYEYTQPVNGDNSILYGFEASLEKQLSFLPSFLNGIGIGGNYTYTNSEMEVSTEGDDVRTITLPGQSKHVMNAFVQYEKYGVSARFAANFNSEFIEEVGGSKEDDRYYEDHLQYDLSVSYAVPSVRNLSVFADFVNLSDEPLKYHSKSGDEEYPLQQEYYSWGSSFGLKYAF